MHSSLFRALAFKFFLQLTSVVAVTVHYAPGQSPLATLPPGVNYTGPEAYNPTTLVPPPLPTAKPSATFDIPLNNSETQGLSIKHTGAFFGFSIEMSVANQVLGRNSSLLAVPFLNLMSNLVQRAGHVRVRVGGNTQESATIIDSFPDGHILEKNTTGLSGTTRTPPLVVSKDLIYLMSNVSKFVNVRWFTGVPFNDGPLNLKLDIMTLGQAVLGDYLLGMQVGNEPDLYNRNGRRPPELYPNYGPANYFGEFGDFIKRVSSDSAVLNSKMLMGPSTCCFWTPEQMWDTGFLDAYKDNLQWVTVEHYPSDNCVARFGNNGTYREAQNELPNYLTHNSARGNVAGYRNSANLALQKNKPILMFETNTASCGGFPGVSDAFVAALWGIDYALQLASASFTGVFMHVGGQNVSYNPFTPPPTNESLYHGWSVGPIYYSALAVAETIGASNNSQIKDINANNDNIYTPGYAVYENGTPVRVALINFMDDSTGGSDYTARISITGQTLSQVKVKYLLAKSVVQKGNITWAGQTYGGIYDTDGRIKGDEDIKTVTCEGGSCPIKVPAPGFALVFLNDNGIVQTAGGTPTTYPTTVFTRTRNTATIDPSVLATSNGQRASSGKKISTSFGSGKSNSAGRIIFWAWQTLLLFPIVALIM